MRVTVDEIKAKLSALPPAWATMVHLGKAGHAEVESASDPAKTYSVTIRTHKDDLGDKSILDTTCTCTATRLCWHVAALYAKVKGMEPVIEPTVPAPARETSLPGGRIVEALGYLGKALEVMVDEVQARVERKMKEGK